MEQMPAKPSIQLGDKLPFVVMDKSKRIQVCDAVGTVTVITHDSAGTPHYGATFWHDYIGMKSFTYLTVDENGNARHV